MNSPKPFDDAASKTLGAVVEQLRNALPELKAEGASDDFIQGVHWSMKLLELGRVIFEANAAQQELGSEVDLDGLRGPLS